MPTNNKSILTAPARLLTALEKQQVFLLRRLGTPMPCPNCGTEQSYIEAHGDTIETFDATADHDDNCTCKHCGRHIRHTVMVFNMGGPGWQWTLIPAPDTPVTVYDTPPVVSKLL